MKKFRGPFIFSFECVRGMGWEAAVLRCPTTNYHPPPPSYPCSRTGMQIGIITFENYGDDISYLIADV